MCKPKKLSPKDAGEIDCNLLVRFLFRLKRMPRIYVDITFGKSVSWCFISWLQRHKEDYKSTYVRALQGIKGSNYQSEGKQLDNLIVY